MSRIGKLAISIPADVTVEVKDNVVTVKGPKDTLTQDYSKNVTVEVKENHIFVTRNDETKDSNAKQGLYRQLISNMVTGVKEGFTKSLTVNGVGYKLSKQGNKLVMNLGLSHPVEIVEEAIENSVNKYFNSPISSTVAFSKEGEDFSVEVTVRPAKNMIYHVLLKY